jgi:hypothetical protein
VGIFLFNRGRGGQYRVNEAEGIIYEEMGFHLTDPIPSYIEHGRTRIRRAFERKGLRSHRRQRSLFWLDTWKGRLAPYRTSAGKNPERVPVGLDTTESAQVLLD